MASLRDDRPLNAQAQADFRDPWWAVTAARRCHVQGVEGSVVEAATAALLHRLL